MHAALEATLAQLCERQDLDSERMESAVAAVMDGACSEVEIAAFLTALRVKGEAVSELVGAARAMQARATPIPTSRNNLLDTCGTGGDGLHTFNISTATAIVLAGCGLPIAKHGNRSVSSTSGSADVLEELGLNLQLSPERVGACLDEIGIGFCFAPLLHTAMRHAAPVRKQLRFRTIFNLIGPLTNPARAEFQLLGANRSDTAAKLAAALAQLGRRRAFVVCGNGELDEVSLWGETEVFEVTPLQVTRHVWTAELFGLPQCQAGELTVHSAAESAEVVRAILKGQPGPARDIVLANAAAGLLAAERAASLKQGVQKAAASIDAGFARQTLERLAAFTHRAQ